MDVNSLNQLKAALESAARRQVAGPLDESRPEASFGSALDSALKQVSDIQRHSSNLQKQFEAGAPSVSLEQTVVAMQKSQIAFQAAVTVRNRLVAAYTDIMNMQV